MTGVPELVGTWRRTGNDPCASKYPVSLRIDANGLYTGEAGEAGAFTWWDSGTWRVKAAGQLALSVANDAVITYTYALTRGVLTITDAEACAVTYRRTD